MKINKNLGLTFLGLIVLLLLINFLGITGKVTEGSDIRLHLSSSEDVLNEKILVVNGGEYVYITIETGSKGIINRVSFYKDLGGKAKGGTPFILDDPNCGDTYCLKERAVGGKFRIHSDWKGRYCAGIREKFTYEDIVKCFEVV